MATTVNTANFKRESIGSGWQITGTLALGTYATSGDTITAASLGLAQIESFLIQDNPSGYEYAPAIATGGGSVVLKIYNGGVSTHTPTGTNSASSVTAQTFTGTAPTAAFNIATPVFSGTGQSSSGQVITTTDNQTMTLNQCAGMWFVSATHGPYMIASNTAVSGAAAVLTIYGTAPTTDAGTYKIINGMTPVGTNGTSTAAAQTFTGVQIVAASATEVANATNLSSLTAIPFVATGL